MGKYNKLICLVFTLFIMLLLQKHCKEKEGLDNLNSFTNCIDDPEWFVEDLGSGRKMFCSDIGNGLSCYDRNAGQVEGWERCLKTCGNCATTTVTVADMRNLSTFSGDPIEDFGVVLFRDDDLKWKGLGVGEDESGSGGGSDDVRNTIGMDESEDIIDIYDRLSTMESLYEMLMGSVSSCVEFRESSNEDKFYSCNGRNIYCNILDDIIPSDDSSVNNQTEENLSAIFHSYLQHQDDGAGHRQILFPTVEMSCNEVSDLLNDELSGSICIVDPNYVPLGNCIVTDDTDGGTLCGGADGGLISDNNCDSTCNWSPITPASAPTSESCATLTSSTCVSDDPDDPTGCKLGKTKKDVCQSYFLLETSLTQDDDDDDDDNRNSPTRISLYDMCPRQCVESCFNTGDEGE